MTKDNLLKRGITRPPECVFCKDHESIDHLFFGCVFAKQIWSEMSRIISHDVGNNYLSIARFWPANKNKLVFNSVFACVMWCIWKFRNSMVFNNVLWSDLKQIWWQIHLTLKKWMILFKESPLEELKMVSQKVAVILTSPFLLTVG